MREKSKTLVAAPVISTRRDTGRVSVNSSCGQSKKAEVIVSARCTHCCLVAYHTSYLSYRETAQVLAVHTTTSEWVVARRFLKALLRRGPHRARSQAHSCTAAVDVAQSAVKSHSAAQGIARVEWVVASPRVVVVQFGVPHPATDSVGTRGSETWLLLSHRVWDDGLLVEDTLRDQRRCGKEKEGASEKVVGSHTSFVFQSIAAAINRSTDARAH